MSKQVVENTKHIDKVYLFIGILMESGGLFTLLQKSIFVLLAILYFVRVLLHNPMKVSSYFAYDFLPFVLFVCFILDLAICFLFLF